MTRHPDFAPPDPLERWQMWALDGRRILPPETQVRQVETSTPAGRAEGETTVASPGVR